ncbi:site-specific DNA-methyltransferase [Candidatus Poribacteria bacterium]|nr:MAG: site-specific DNA-methyltransferase [Candidatus Poribacteria bacterium]
MSKHQLYYGDNLEILQKYVPDESVNLIYIDPPFNTGKLQQRTEIQVEQDTVGDRVGFQGRTYRTHKGKTTRYTDKFESSDAYLQFLRPRFEEAYRVLHPRGSFFLHIDYREVHYCKVILDEIFGREAFVNEIIWAYDYGGRSKSRWPAKHDNILWYAKTPAHYTFNFEAMDRIPYMAPGLVGKAKAARGKTPTDVWWHTIVNTNGNEKTGYPTQKPLGILNRIVKVHSSPDDILLDFFAGSGTLGEAAALHNRSSILIDNNIPAIKQIMNRLALYGVELINVDYAVLSTHRVE